MSANATRSDAGKLFPEWESIEKIADLRPEEVEALPFGAIQLDALGRILTYNRAESELAGRDPQQVIGKSFFEEVAPCTNVKEFGGRFREGFAAKDLNAVFPYVFDFKMNPTSVWVRLFYSRETDTAWVFVRKRVQTADQ